MLGPLLFIVYTGDLAAVAQKRNVTVVTVHAFADADDTGCICTAVVTTVRRQLFVMNAASMMSVNDVR